MILTNTKYHSWLIKSVYKGYNGFDCILMHVCACVYKSYKLNLLSFQMSIFQI
jgi:hypothetical protein